MSWLHVHLLINHLPVIGTWILLGLLAMGAPSMGLRVRSATALRSFPESRWEAAARPIVRPGV